MHTLRILFSTSAYPTLESAAKKLLASPALHSVIFGHTHLPMVRQPIPGKSYINSGTWIPNTNLHISALGRTLMQTYVFVEYEGDGRPRISLKLWHGRRVVEEDIVL
jgi:hypothetical protein